MSKSSESAPYALLGDKLKHLREQHQESLAEAAGAVEIAEDQLEQIEQGYERPSEEILMLLINHFGMHEDEAVNLWEMAGYDDSDDQGDNHDSNNIGKTIVMAIAMDPRVMYSDSVHVAGSKHGIILSFLQPGTGQQAMPISRIGMSREQARNMMALLKDTLDTLDQQHKPKQLPPGDNPKN